jgi:hypothetical protein
LATIGRIYVRAERALGHPPANADDLKSHLQAGEDLKALLVSPNDSQPYVIVWGTKMVSPPDPSVVMAYERAGANGYRRVLTPTGTRMVADADFARCVFPPGHKPGGS